LDQLSLEDWNHVIGVNLTGPFLCTREALRIMKPQGSGRIINIGSISAQRVRLNSAPYSTSKHGLWGLTQVTALEGREYGVTCGCLHPGNVRVERRSTNTRSSDKEPMMAVEDIAQAAVLMATLPPTVTHAGSDRLADGAALCRARLTPATEDGGTAVGVDDRAGDLGGLVTG